jgi:uncharacterized protein (TIGR03435 family)
MFVIGQPEETLCKRDNVSFMFARKLSFSRTLTFSFCSFNMAVQPFVWCQRPLAGAAPQAQQAPPATPKAPLVVSIAPYDVASIRMHPSSYRSSMHVTTDNGSLSAENATLQFLIRFAYFLPRKLLVGGPAWIGDRTFDIKAKTDSVSFIDRGQLSEKQRELYNTQKQIPLQKLLEDRFQLKTHHEDRAMHFYGIVLAKGGIRMKPSGEKSDLEEFTKAHVQDSVVPGIPGIRVMGRGRIVAVRTTLDQLAQYLTAENWGDVDQPVLNKTGLTGEYDFTLEWTPSSSQDDTASDSSLFTAIQEQLGLKLESQKGPVEVTVVDHAELPSEN